MTLDTAGWTSIRKRVFRNSLASAAGGRDHLSSCTYNCASRVFGCLQQYGVHVPVGIEARLRLAPQSCS